MLILMSLSAALGLRAQQGEIRQLRFHSAHNCFPDTARNNGHLDGDGILQPKAGHYDDSSVLLVIPRDLHAGKTVDLSEISIIAPD